MIGWLQPSHRNTAMGTPQMRWRLMHQSGRVAIMLVMRSLPQAGSQTTLSISSIVKLAERRLRSVGALHRRFQRDEPLLGGAEDDGIVAAPAVRIGVLQVRVASSARCSSSMATMMGFACQTVLPSKGGRAAQRPGVGVDMEAPGGIDAAGLVEVVTLAGVEVVCAVRGSGVDRAGARCRR